jgi:hypothetical protein
MPASLVIDLPQNVSMLAPTDSPLREILAAARCGDLIVTNDLSRSVGPGPVEVTWTAWKGQPRESPPVATRTETITVRAAASAVAAASHERDSIADNAVARAEMGKPADAGPEPMDLIAPRHNAEGTVLFTLRDILYYVPNLISRHRQ